MKFIDDVNSNHFTDISFPSNKHLLWYYQLPCCTQNKAFKWKNTSRFAIVLKVDKYPPFTLTWKKHSLQL